MIQDFQHHPQWKEVIATCARLRSAGFVALLAGGCVRDWLMKRAPHDFDIATSALPDQIEALFPDSISVGKQFGVIILPKEGFQIEVATFRQDGAYSDGRRPNTVVFSDPQHDAERRDFTVNALFYDVQAGQLLDFVNGQKDLELRLLRTVGDPGLRFSEDKLRILRAVRFAAQLQFTLEGDTWAMVKKMAPEIHAVSNERIRDELCKLLASPGRAHGLELLLESKLLDEIWPELAIWARNEATSVSWSALIHCLQQMVEDEVTASHGVLLTCLAFYLENASPQRLKQISGRLRELKFAGQDVNEVSWCLQHAPLFLPEPATDPATNPDAVPEADVLLAMGNGATGEKLLVTLGFWFPPEKAKIYKNLWQTWRIKYLPEGALPKPWITGEHLKALKLSPGPQFGELLSGVYKLQLLQQLANPAAALDWVRSKAKQSEVK